MFSEYCIVHSIILLIVANTNQIDAITKWPKSLFHVNSSCKFDDGEKLPRLLIPSCHLVRPQLSLSWSIFLSSKECWNSHPGSWLKRLPDWNASWSNPPCNALLISINFIQKSFLLIMAEKKSPDSKVHGANMGPTWVLSAPGGPHVGPMDLAIREGLGASWLWLPPLWSVRWKSSGVSRVKRTALEHRKFFT